MRLRWTMHLLQSGVDITVIALWLGHEDTATTHLCFEADLAMKEAALKRLDGPSLGRHSRSSSCRSRVTGRGLVSAFVKREGTGPASAANSMRCRRDRRRCCPPPRSAPGARPSSGGSWPACRGSTPPGSQPPR